MTRVINVSSSSVIGRDHKRLWRNNQDGVGIASIDLDGKTYRFGIICDGCSRGINNEVGAKLMVTYLCSEISMILSMGTDLNNIPQVLFNRCIGYLRSIASLTTVGNPQQSIEFIKHHLLFTILGFIMDDEKIIIFSAGDGVIVINDEINRIDQDNKPSYLAYSLIDRRSLDLEKELPQSFVTRLINLANIERIAICSDGITETAINRLWGNSTSLNLTRKLKVLANNDEPFDDDCTVITIEFINNTQATTINKTIVGD